MTQAISRRAFEPGTGGWTLEDLNHQDILWHWSQGRYELVEGVLTKMAPQGFESIDPLEELRVGLESHFRAIGQHGKFYHETDVLLSQGRVARPDMVFLTADQRREQKRISRERGLPERRYHPIYVSPLLIVESVSIGHEAHDRVTKRAWYAQARVHHYWLLTAHEQSLVCLELQGHQYIETASGRNTDVLVSSAFEGARLNLAALWD